MKSVKACRAGIFPIGNPEVRGPNVFEANSKVPTHLLRVRFSLESTAPFQPGPKSAPHQFWPRPFTFTTTEKTVGVLTAPHHNSMRVDVIQLPVVLALIICAALFLTLPLSTVLITCPGSLGRDSRLQQQSSSSNSSEAGRFTLAAAEQQFKCLNNSGFVWQPKNGKPSKVMAMPGPRTTPIGFQARCDLVVGSRSSASRTVPLNTAWGNTSSLVRTVFVRTDKIQAFYHRILPCLPAPFVLVIGDCDDTTPRQVDLRYPKVLSRKLWYRLLADERILHIFVEHLDEAMLHSNKLSGLPVGINAEEYADQDPDSVLQHVASQEQAAQILQRPLKVLQIDRIRDGPQWEDRKHVRRLCESAWSSFCIPGVASGSGSPFWQQLRNVSFLLCVHGGGLDPSPKAWEALLQGAIPIIQHFVGDEVYRQLPVVFVDSWHDGSLSAESLAKWRERLSPYFTDPGKRTEVLRRLNSQYWWDKVELVLADRSNELMLNESTDFSIEWRPEVNFTHDFIHDGTDLNG